MLANDTPNTLILDVDGVLTTGSFFYSSEGKVYKEFGPDDNDALSILKEHVNIHFVTGDKKGFAISSRRIKDDMGYPLDLVSTIKRVEWISSLYDPKRVIYMGDGIFDYIVMESVAYSIAPANADDRAKDAADFVCQRRGGDRAVAEACLHILEKFFVPFNAELFQKKGMKFSGEWTV